MWPFDRNAADFILQHGCDISAEQDGENVAKKVNMFLSDEAFEYLLDNHIQLSADFWDELFMMDKASLIEIAMHHNMEIPSEAVFQPFINLSTIQAYGDNGGNLDLYSENTQSSLIDFFVSSDKNDIVEYLRSKGLTPSDGAMSLRQLIDELESLK